MKLTLRNLTEWLRRSGDTTPARGMSYGEIVQPVEIAGDLSHLSLSAEQYGRLSLAGGRIPAVAEDIAVELTAGRFGAIVKAIWIETTQGSAQDFQYGITPLAGPIAWAVMNVWPTMGKGLSVVRGGTKTGSDNFGDTYPNVRTSNANLIKALDFHSGVFLLPGQRFVIDTSQTAITSGAQSITVLWDEFEV